MIVAVGVGRRFHVDAAAQGGANNKVFKVTAGSHQAVLKIYFQHPKDPRDRLAAEFEFGSFAWNNGVKTVPRPLVQDPRNNFALYEYVAGRPLDADDINAERVHDAAAFFAEINRHKGTQQAVELPLASEAFFSVEQHLAGVGRRIDGLGALRTETDIGPRRAIVCVR